MKSEAEIRQMLRRLDDMHDEGFNGDLEKYTSTMYEDEEGKPQVFEDEDASSILGKIQIAQYILEWILEEGLSLSVRPIENEIEARLSKNKILVDGEGKEYVKDCSVDAFIAKVEGQF